MIAAIGKNVTARLMEGSSMTKSGLYLAPGVADQLAPKVAEILNVGDEITKVKVGDKVVFKPYATYEMEINKQKFVMLEEEDILGVLREDTKK